MVGAPQRVRPLGAHGAGHPVPSHTAPRGARKERWGAISTMAIEVVTKDCTALTDAELGEMADMGAGSAVE